MADAAERPKPNSTTIVVTTANICHLPLRSRARVARRIAQAMTLNRFAAVIGQEIEDHNYSNAWLAGAVKTGRRTYGLGQECPVSVPKSWKVIASAVIKSHDGMRGVSPNRYITSVKAEVDGLKVAIVGCHTVSKPRRGVDHSAWRIGSHAEYRKDMRNLIAKLHTQGFTVFFGGDMNMTKVPTIINGQLEVAHSGYDHLWVLPAKGVRLTHHYSKRIAPSRLLGMDHPIVSAISTLEHKEN